MVTAEPPAENKSKEAMPRTDVDAGSLATAPRTRPGVSDEVPAKEAAPGNVGQDVPSDPKQKHSAKVEGGTPSPPMSVTLASIELFEKVMELEDKAAEEEIEAAKAYRHRSWRDALGPSSMELCCKRQRVLEENSAKLGAMKKRDFTRP